MKYQHVNSKQVITIVGQFTQPPSPEIPRYITYYKFIQTGKEDDWGAITPSELDDLIAKGIMVAL